MLNTIGFVKIQSIFYLNSGKISSSSVFFYLGYPRKRIVDPTVIAKLLVIPIHYTVKRKEPTSEVDGSHAYSRDKLLLYTIPNI